MPIAPAAASRVVATARRRTRRNRMGSTAFSVIAAAGIAVVGVRTLDPGSPQQAIVSPAPGLPTTATVPATAESDSARSSMTTLESAPATALASGETVIEAVPDPPPTPTTNVFEDPAPAVVAGVDQSVPYEPDALLERGARPVALPVRRGHS